MADRYVDTTASGANDGSSWTDAWETLDDAFAGTNSTRPAAGETVYCYSNGATNADVAIAADGTIAGSDAAGYVKFIGVGVNTGTPPAVDGTKFVMDGGDARANCIDLVDANDYLWFENFECKQATGDGIDVGSADLCIFLNCSSHDNGDNGWDSIGYSCHFVLCQSYSNGGEGFFGNAAEVRMYMCVAYNNTDDGIYLSASSGTVIKCITHNNGNYGIRVGVDGLVESCVVDDEDVGIDCTGDRYMVMANRITNCDTDGIDFNSQLGIAGWNLFHENIDDTQDDTLAYNISYKTAVTNATLSGGIDGTNKEDPDADDGYSGQGTDDFNLKTSRTYNGDGTDTAGLNIGS